MHTLHLLRHAKSAWDDPGLEDHDRPLAPRGRRAARVMALHFRRLEADPELILCSSALRARETLDLVMPGFRAPPLVAFERGLYLAGADSMLARLRTVEERIACVMVIGHNPGMQELALTLAQSMPAKRSAPLARKFPTAALATYAIETPWSRLTARGARLLAYVTPAELEAE